MAEPTSPGVVVEFDDPDGASPVTIVFWVVQAWSGEPRNRDLAEHDELRWFLPGELSGVALADPSYPALIERLLGAGQDRTQRQNG